MKADDMINNLSRLRELNRLYIQSVCSGDEQTARQCIDEMMTIKLYEVDNDEQN